MPDNRCVRCQFKESASYKAHKPRMRKKRIIYVVSGFLSLALVGALLLGKNVIACTLIEYSDFDETAPGIYLEPGLTKAETQQFFILYEAAKERIRNTYGEYTARPTIIAIRSPDKIKQYGNAYGVAYFIPGKSFVVIGPEGHNADVIAHELMHAELNQRVGYWKRMTQIPSWFDEGVAMQVDYRQSFNIENFENAGPLNRQKLWFAGQFHSGNIQKIMENYAISKHEVNNWRMPRKKSHLYEKLEEIRGGKNFDDAFM